MTRVYVAAGSNVQPASNLVRALNELRQHFPDLVTSTAYRNQAAGFEGDDFINLVCSFESDLDVRSVIARLHEAEAACGRERNAPRWAPRSMDLDILLFGDMVCDEPGLVLPRPDLTRKAYMLGPRAELAPEEVHPLSGRTMRALWNEFDQQAHPMQAVDIGWTGTGRPD